MLPKKQIERFHIDQLIRNTSSFPQGDLYHVDKDPPDFLFLTTTGEKIGIEHTRLYRPKPVHEKYSLQEIISLKEIVVEVAEKIFLEKHGLPLHINIAFQDNLNLPKREITSLASTISDLLYSKLKDQDLASNFFLKFDIKGELSKFIIEITAHYFYKIKDSVWQVSEGYLLPNLEGKLITDVIFEKSVAAQAYLNEFDKLFLLLVVRDLNHATWFDKLEIPPRLNFEMSCFEKIFLLSCWDNGVIDIK